MEMLLAAGAAAVAIYSVARLGKRLYLITREFFTLQAVAARLISAEMQPNGGSTLLDKVNKIAGNHQEAERHWTALQENQVEVATKLETSYEELRGAFRNAHAEITHRLEKIEHTVATPQEVP